MTTFEYEYLLNNLYYDYAEYVNKNINKTKLGYYSENKERIIITLSNFIELIEDYRVTDTHEINPLTASQMDNILSAVSYITKKQYSLKFA